MLSCYQHLKITQFLINDPLALAGYPCPGYYKQCCDEHWGTRVSFPSGFLGVYAQQWVISQIRWRCRTDLWGFGFVFFENRSLDLAKWRSIDDLDKSCDAGKIGWVTWLECVQSKRGRETETVRIDLFALKAKSVMEVEGRKTRRKCKV